MSVGRFAGIVLGFTFGGALCGALIGFILGQFFPEFPMMLFGREALLANHFGQSIGIMPVRLGVGMGLANGSGFGCVAGIVYLLIDAFGKREKTSPN